ncbi:MAG: hypothetical protein FH758_09620 [Firmicutes bacterium]|nr:hypothetical protein [Bacillota bacterium]
MRPVTRKHTVSVLGIDLPVANSHRQLADSLAAELQKKMRDIVAVEFINILGRELDKFPIQLPLLLKSKLPLVLLDGEHRFNGNVTAGEIVNAIRTNQRPAFPPFFAPRRQVRMLPKQKKV